LSLKPISRAQRAALAVLAAPIDALVSGAIAVAVGGVALFIRLFPRRRRRRIALLVPGADMQAIADKFGSLDPYLDDLVDGFFEHAYRFLFCASVNRRIELRDDFTVFSRRVPLRLFPLTYVGRLVWEMSTLAWRERVGVIHARDPNFCGAIALAAARVSNTPFCVSIHADYDKRFALDASAGAPTLFGSRHLVRRIEAFVLPRADRVFPIRAHLAEDAISRGARPDTVRVTPHGINLLPIQTWNPAVFSWPSVPDGRRIISFVGRLSKENYVDDVLEAARRVGRLRRDCVFVLVGGGGEESRLRSAIDDDPVLSDVVRMVGFQPHERAIDLRCRSTVNLALMGGFSLIEACAAGHPVIAYDVEWHNELVQDGVTGFLVREHDIEALAERVLYLLETPEATNRMGAAARALAFSRHALAEAMAVKSRCYGELLEEAR